MKLLLDRKFRNCRLGQRVYCVGRLYIDGTYFCDTIEDEDRGLHDNMTAEEVRRVKVFGKTAIPTGKYKVSINIVSPKYKNSEYYQRFANGSRVPRLMNVKGFDGVLIHCGNTEGDSAGCVIVGENKVKGQVINSKLTFEKLYKKLQEATDEITLEIKKQ